MADGHFSMHCGRVRRLPCVRVLSVVDGEFCVDESRTIRAMISENSTKKTQATAFSYFSFAGNMGICVGPLVGMSP